MCQLRRPAEPERADGQTPQERATVYLLPGQLVATREPTRITTILGSCVAVCMWDTGSGAGGMNHFLLPTPGGAEASPHRFGSLAVPELLERVRALAGHRSTVHAKVFGGACVLKACRDDRNHLGKKNAAIALRLLAELHIPVIATDTEGEHGRKLVFDTCDGSAWVRLL